MGSIFVVDFFFFFLIYNLIVLSYFPVLVLYPGLMKILTRYLANRKLLWLGDSQLNIIGFFFNSFFLILY
jgi:hypothetical protein